MFFSHLRLLIVCRLIVFILIILYIMEGCNYGYCKSFWNQLKKNIVLNWDCHKKLLLTNVVCIVPISVQSNVIAVAFHLKTFSVLLMHLKSRLTNCFWRNLYE